MSAVRTASQHSLKGIAFRDAGNVLRTATAGKARDASNVLRPVFGVLAVGLSATSVFGNVNSGGAIDITTPSVTATPTGGSAPYTAAWTQTGGDTFTITNPSALTTSFVGVAVAPSTASTGTFVCTITDASGQSIASAVVTAKARNIGTSGGGVLP